MPGFFYAPMKLVLRSAVVRPEEVGKVARVIWNELLNREEAPENALHLRGEVLTNRFPVEVGVSIPSSAIGPSDIQAI